MDSPHNTSPPPSGTSFPTRPFPPPALVDVPVEYILDRLHSLAPHYWNKPETADCTIMVPLPRPSSSSNITTVDPLQSIAPSPAKRSTIDPNSTGRRATAPDVNTAPRLTLRLHVDYLSAKSALLRGLFSGASPLDLIQSMCSSRQSPSAPLRVPRNRLPRLLPSPPSHPLVYLPVPDPSSIQLLFHWMYFGDTDHIETYLDQGDIRWEGLARNVEYLGLPADIKVFLGRWYGNWLLPSRCRPGSTPCVAGESDESDVESECDDQDESDRAEDTSPSSSLSEEFPSDGEWNRGRTRAVRPLTRLFGQRLCTA